MDSTAPHTPPTGNDAGSEEIFAPIPGFPGYLVGDRGTVLSTKQRRPRELRPMVKSNGYASVNLALGTYRSSRTLTVHTLVAEAFIGPRPEGLLVLHADGTRTNSDVSNLRWGTQAENIQDAFRHGTMTPAVARSGHGTHASSGPRTSRAKHPDDRLDGRGSRCRKGHLYDDANTYRWGDGSRRRCRTCHLAGVNARRQKVKQ